MDLLRMTPEIRTELATLVQSLRTPVKELNALVKERVFALMVEEDAVQFPLGDYDEVRKEWLTDGAISDFVAKMGESYQHFDADKYEEDSEEAKKKPDPQSYVRCKWRKVRFGGLGSIWLDLPLCGRVGGRKVCKWTRVAFVLQEVLAPGEYAWDVHFDPTGDHYGFDNPQGSLEYVNLMQTGGHEVDLKAPREQ